MNTPTPNTSHSCGTIALTAWIVALILFLICLAWAVSSGVNADEAARFFHPGMKVPESQTLPLMGRADPGAVLDNLPARGTIPLPVQLSGTAPAGTTHGKSSWADTSPAASVPAPEYVLSGAGLQGFYQNSAPDEVWTLDYSAPQLSAQLIRRGPPTPQLVTEGVTVTWELAPVKKQGKEQSKGQKKGGAHQGTMTPVEDSWFQASIPLSELLASGREENPEKGTFDPYPVLTLRAVGTDGKLLAESAAVLAIAPGFGCAHCHDNAGTAILEAHDRHQGTNFLAQHAKGEIIACRTCHDGLTITDGKERAGRGMSVSAAIHGWHAPYLTDMAANACMTCHIALGRSKNTPGEQPQALFARDFHVERGIDCARCHGVMEDHSLALLKAEKDAGQPLAAPAMAAITPRSMPVADMDGRLPWVQEPDCTSCHDFITRPDPRTASAFNKWTPADEGASGLYSERRDDMLMVRCIVCHGAPHAVYPAKNPLAENLDNIPPVQYQKLAAPLGSKGNCAICHGQPMDYSAHHPLVEQDTAK